MQEEAVLHPVLHVLLLYNIIKIWNALYFDGRIIQSYAPLEMQL